MSYVLLFPHAVLTVHKLEINLIKYVIANHILLFSFFWKYIANQSNLDKINHMSLENDIHVIIFIDWLNSNFTPKSIYGRQTVC